MSSKQTDSKWHNMWLSYKTSSQHKEGYNKVYKLKKAKIHDVKILEQKDTAIALGNPCTKNPWILGAFWGGLFSSYIPLLASLFGLHLVLDIWPWS